MKRLMIAVALAATTAAATAETYNDGNIDWSYTNITADTVQLYAGEYTAAIPSNTVGSVVVPDQMNGATVKSAGDYAFYMCRSVSNITLSASVTNVGAYCFSFDAVLENVEFPDGFKTIGNSAFYSCGVLSELELPNTLESIGDMAFYFSGLKSMTIPDSVTNIGEYAFAKASITNVTIGSGVTALKAGVFGMCSSLTSVNIPDGVTEIDERAFFRCSSLTEIVIPDSVTNIAAEAFAQTGITSVSLPAGCVYAPDAFPNGCAISQPSSVTSVNITAIDVSGTTVTLTTDYTSGTSAAVVSSTTLSGLLSAPSTNDVSVANGVITLKDQGTSGFYKVIVK